MRSDQARIFDVRSGGFCNSAAAENIGSGNSQQLCILHYTEAVVRQESSVLMFDLRILVPDFAGRKTAGALSEKRCWTSAAPPVAVFAVGFADEMNEALGGKMVRRFGVANSCPGPQGI